MKLVEISQNLLQAAKTKNGVFNNVKHLSTLSLGQLLISLETDEKKKTFWINIYNSFAIILLQPNPKIILNPLKRKKFFNKKQIVIAGIYFSLNDIEHNILRKSRIWWSKGYLKKYFVNELEKNLRVVKLDPRIHFALNCGGMGCPPIRFYEVKKINQQLDIATQAFLFSEAKNDKKTNTIQLSKLFNWYIGDFGGKNGIIKFLKSYKIIGATENPHIIYSSYNWDPWIK